MAMEWPLVLMMAPPLRTLAREFAWWTLAEVLVRFRKLGDERVGLRMPPLKLKMAVALPETLMTRPVVRMPPFRLTVPVPVVRLAEPPLCRTKPSPVSVLSRVRALPGSKVSVPDLAQLLPALAAPAMISRPTAILTTPPLLICSKASAPMLALPTEVPLLMRFRVP